MSAAARVAGAPEEMWNEADISTIEPAAEADARVPGADADAGRPGGAEPAAEPRPQTHGGLTPDAPTADGMATKPSLTLPASMRLRLRRGFDGVYRSGIRTRGRCATLVTLQPSPDGTFKFAVVVRKKEYRRAVDRNRVRRRYRELVRLHRHRLDSPVWLVIQVLASAGGAAWLELEAEFTALCARAGIARP